MNLVDHDGGIGRRESLHSPAAGVEQGDQQLVDSAYCDGGEEVRFAQVLSPDVRAIGLVLSEGS